MSRTVAGAQDGKLWSDLGDDSISLASDGDPDVVACGEGFDSVRYPLTDESGIDTLRDCEEVTVGQ